MPLDQTFSPWKMLTGALCTLGLVAIVAHSSVLAGGKRLDSSAEVKVSATASKVEPDGKQTVTVTLVMNKGWHVYANPVRNEDLSSAQTVVTVNAKVKPEVKVMYPPGKVHVDKVTGNYMTYEEKVNIAASVQRAAGDTSPLEVSVRFMACDNKNCLLPATVKINLP